MWVNQIIFLYTFYFLLFFPNFQIGFEKLWFSYLKFRQTTEHYFKMKTISNKLFRLYKYLSDLNYIYLWHNTLSSLFYELHTTHKQNTTFLQ